MKRAAASLCAVICAMTLSACDADSGDGGVIGTIRSLIDGTEPVTETVTPAAEETTAASEHRSDDTESLAYDLFSGHIKITQREDTMIGVDGDVKELEGYTSLQWVFGFGEDSVKTVPVEIKDGTVADLDIISLVYDELADSGASETVKYSVIMTGVRNGVTYVISNPVESSVYYNDYTGGNNDEPSFLEAVMAADDLAHVPDFLDEMRVRSHDGKEFKAKPADAHEEYYYGSDPDESGFHIVMTTMGVVQCIGRSGEYDGSDAVIAIMHNGSDVTLFKADIENGVADIHGEDDAEEGIYSVFVVESMDGDLRRISNILEYQLVQLT